LANTGHIENVAGFMIVICLRTML